jgi:hypothetical protein
LSKKKEEIPKRLLFRLRGPVSMGIIYAQPFLVADPRFLPCVSEVTRLHIACVMTRVILLDFSRAIRVDGLRG